MKFSLEHTLPVKATLNAEKAGVLAKRSDKRKTQRAKSGVLLLSMKQLMLRQDKTVERVSVTEPFQLQLSQWPMEDSRVELQITVGQRGQRVRFCARLPGEVVVGLKLPRQEATAPLISAQDFRRLWPPLRELAQAHGHSALPELNLQEMDLSLAPKPTAELMSPPPFTELTLVTYSHDKIVFRRRASWLHRLGLYLNFFIFISLIVVWPEFALFMGTIATISSLFTLVQRPDLLTQLMNITISADQDDLSVTRWPLGNTSLPIDDIDQIFVTYHIKRSRVFSYHEEGAILQRDTAGGYAKLHALMMDGSTRTLVPAIPHPPDAIYLEQMLEAYLHIKDRAVPGEWDAIKAVRRRSTHIPGGYIR